MKKKKGSSKKIAIVGPGAVTDAERRRLRSGIKKKAAKKPTKKDIVKAAKTYKKKK